MLKFFKWLYIVGASIFGILFLAASSEWDLNKHLAMVYLIATIMFLLNAFVFHKLDCMEDDIIAIKKRLGMSEETTQDEAQNQSDNTPSQQG